MIYETLSAIYLPIYLPQLSLSISFDLFIHFSLITPAMRRSATQAPFRVPFHQIQQQHLLGFHQGDCSIRRQTSSNYPVSLRSTHSLMTMKKCSK